MATNGDHNIERPKFFETVKHFPSVINGRLNVVEFLNAAQDLLRIVDRLGSSVTPVKYDMQGNIDKIRQHYDCNVNACLLELMLNEKTKGRPGVESVVWLNRAMFFFELTFEQLISLLNTNTLDVPIKKILTLSYERSVKKYHSWVTQQIFAVICKMAPTIPQFLQAIEADKDLETFNTTLNTFNIKLHLIRCEIDDFVKENHLFEI